VARSSASGSRSEDRRPTRARPHARCASRRRPASGAPARRRRPQKLPGLAALVGDGAQLLAHRPGRRAVVRLASGATSRWSETGRADRWRRGTSQLAALLAGLAVVPEVLDGRRRPGRAHRRIRGPAVGAGSRRSGRLACGLAPGRRGARPARRRGPGRARGPRRRRRGRGHPRLGRACRRRGRLPERDVDRPLSGCEDGVPPRSVSPTATCTTASSSSPTAGSACSTPTPSPRRSRRWTSRTSSSTWSCGSTRGCWRRAAPGRRRRSCATPWTPAPRARATASRHTHGRPGCGWPRSTASARAGTTSPCGGSIAGDRLRSGAVILTGGVDRNAGVVRVGRVLV
jgi:hypothetical protein